MRWVFQVPSLGAAILKLLVDTADALVAQDRKPEGGDAGDVYACLPDLTP